MHFDGKRFYNPSGATVQPVRELPKLFLARRTKWPRSVPVTQTRPPVLAKWTDLNLTFIGHATFLLQTSQGNVLFDPVWSQRASPLSFAGPKRARQPGVRFEDLPDIHVVLVSHNHYDHCDLDTLKRIASRWDPLVVTPLGNGELLRSTGLKRVREIDWWQSPKEAPFSITAMPAQHFSARTLWDRNRALWASFGLEVSGRRIFFAGDSGYGPHFMRIRERFGRPHVALLPIGAYEPRWFMKDIHMNPVEAVHVHHELESFQSVAMHFGTFQLTPEGIDEPVRELKAALAERQTPEGKFRVMEVGETLVV